jgi:hypothetical protein
MSFIFPTYKTLTNVIVNQPEHSNPAFLILQKAKFVALVLTAVGWKLREVFNAPSTPHNFMKRADVEKILDESAGKIVGVTFIKKDGSERTLVGRIGKKYTPPPGSYPQHSKSARRGRGHFTIYDMQKGAFRLINMASVIGIRAEGTSHTA